MLATRHFGGYNGLQQKVPHGENRQAGCESRTVPLP